MTAGVVLLAILAAGLYVVLGLAHHRITRKVGR